jgi:NAD-dependent SIR2 family protein deacetylase
VKADAKAARLIDAADSLIITAGAGMGVDSGLPDFRGEGGFWKHYPALAKSGLNFEQIADPQHFKSDPRLAWGFYGHRLNLYRKTVPHDGFRLLLDIAKTKPAGYFVFTSNVDGQFQIAGFPAARIVECHGSIHYLQCIKGCSPEIWSAEGFNPTVDEGHCRLTSDLPTCQRCGAVARPNILMFGDWNWTGWRSRMQEAKFWDWREQAKNPVVIELGAGTAIPTVRLFGQNQNCPVIRINPQAQGVSTEQDVQISTGALEGVKGIANCLRVDLDFTAD